jgi:hypothetical protein
MVNEKLKEFLNHFDYIRSYYSEDLFRPLVKGEPMQDIVIDRLSAHMARHTIDLLKRDFTEKFKEELEGSNLIFDDNGIDE